jgi:hypothetical protein
MVDGDPTPDGGRGPLGQSSVRALLVLGVPCHLVSRGICNAPRLWSDPSLYAPPSSCMHACVLSLTLSAGPPTGRPIGPGVSLPGGRGGGTGTIGRGGEWQGGGRFPGAPVSGIGGRGPGGAGSLPGRGPGGGAIDPGRGTAGIGGTPGRGVGGGGTPIGGGGGGGRGGQVCSSAAAAARCRMACVFLCHVCTVVLPQCQATRNLIDRGCNLH